MKCLKTKNSVTERITFITLYSQGVTLHVSDHLGWQVIGQMCYNLTKYECIIKLKNIVKNLDTASGRD